MTSFADQLGLDALKEASQGLIAYSVKGGIHGLLMHSSIQALSPRLGAWRRVSAHRYTFESCGLAYALQT